MGVCSSSTSSNNAKEKLEDVAPPVPPPSTDAELLTLFEALADAWSKNFTELGTGGDPTAFNAMFKQDVEIKMHQYREDNIAAVGAAADMTIFNGPEEQKSEGSITFNAMVQGLLAKLGGEEYARTDCHCYGVKLTGETTAQAIMEFKRFNKSDENYDGGYVLVSAEYIDGKYLFTEMWTWATESAVKKAPEAVQAVFRTTLGLDESNADLRVRGFLKSKPYHEEPKAAEMVVAQAS